MKQEHDYSGDLEAFERLLKFFDEHCDMYCIETLEQEYADDEQCFTDIATIRAALTAAKGDGWLPIESAPRGIVIDTYGYLSLSHSDIEKPIRMPDDYISPNTPYPLTKTNIVIDDMHGNYTRTHWRHIPKPPQDGGDDD